jgi:hypothetical protein
MKLEFLRQIFEKYKSKFMQVCPVGAELFHTDGQAEGRTDGQTERQTDTTQQIVAFRNFANAPKM